MTSKVGTSIIIAAALFGASMQLPAASCIFSNAPSEKACAPACCANKACCETSQNNTAPTVPPLAKPSSDQQNIATFPVTAAVAVLNQPATIKSHILCSAALCAHSPPTLALICIRLI